MTMNLRLRHFPSERARRAFERAEAQKRRLLERPWVVGDWLHDERAFEEQSAVLIHEWCSLGFDVRAVELVLGPLVWPVSYRVQAREPDGCWVMPGVRVWGPFMRVPVVERVPSAKGLNEPPGCGMALRVKSPEVSAWCNRLENRMVYG